MKNLKDYMNVTEASKFLGVTAFTLRNWDNAGIFKAYRNPMNNYRLYLIEDLQEMLKKIRDIT